MKICSIFAFTLCFISSSTLGFAQRVKVSPGYKEYHVAVNGNDNNPGTLSSPYKTIMAAANKAIPDDVITIHAGTYRESIVPPRGGNSEQERITYQAAKGEKVTVKGSEIAKGWKKQQHDTWMLKLPNSFFGSINHLM